MSTRARKRLLISGGLALIVSGVFTSAYLLTFFSTTQIRATDFLFKSRTGERSRSTVIVGIDQRSYRTLLPEYGAMTHWPRTLYARAVEALEHAGARVLAFDIFFDAPTAEDETVSSVFRQAGNIILPLEAQGPGKPNPDPGVAQTFEVLFRTAETIRGSAAAEGFVNVTTDPDTVVRSMPLLLRVGSEDVPALSLVAVARFIRRPIVLDAPSADNQVFAAGRAIPLRDTNSMMINYLGPPSSVNGDGPFTIIPFVDVLNGTYAEALVADKMVIVGLTVRGIDEFSTPTTTNTRMWGVEVLGNAIETILGQRYLMPVARNVTIGLIVLLGILAGLLVALFRPSIATIGVVFLLGLYLFIAGVCFDSGLLLNLVYPPGALLGGFGAAMVYRVGFEQAEQRKMQELMGRYLSPTVSQWVLRAPDSLMLGGQTQNMTVLFADLRGFTTLSHTLAPQALVSLLNEYMTAMTRIVFKHDGVLDKYIGDALMAFWNAPMSQPDHARKACDTALEMLSTLRALQGQWRQRGMPLLEVGIGINTGSMVVGNMGSMERLAYTVMGDAVNVASRLEGLSKEYGTRTVIGETTQAEAGSAFEYRELDRVAVKGREKPLIVYEVVARAGELNSDFVELLKRYHFGLELYRTRQWGKAQKVFRDILATSPDDGPSALYLRRSTEYNAEPPSAEWNGVYVAKTK